MTETEELELAAIERAVVARGLRYETTDRVIVPLLVDEQRMLTNIWAEGATLVLVTTGPVFETNLHGCADLSGLWNAGHCWPTAIVGPHQVYLRCDQLVGPTVIRGHLEMVVNTLLNGAAEAFGWFSSRLSEDEAIERMHAQIGAHLADEAS